MGASNIEWTDETWNPVTGCTKVSPGCKNCYAKTMAGRGIGSFTGGRKFEDVRCHDDRLDAPLRWRKPKRVFVNSMSDLFHDAVSDAFLARVFTVMALAPRHTFQILTKRPERMRAWFEMQGANPCAFIEEARNYGGDWTAVPMPGVVTWPLPNVWLGVSCEDQQRADERIPLLFETPAAVRFLSCEPLLAPIDLRGGSLHRGADFLCNTREHATAVSRACADGYVDGPEADAAIATHQAERGGSPWIDWVIAGGESGPGARPCDVAWIRSLVAQCRGAGVACFVKQLGAKPVARDRWDMGEQAFVDADAAGWTESDGAVVMRLRDRKGGNPAEWPEDLRVREFPGRRVSS